jgi:hypothetical protein
VEELRVMQCDPDIDHDEKLRFREMLRALKAGAQEQGIGLGVIHHCLMTFGRLMADEGLDLAYEPDNFPALFKRLKAGFRDDPDRLVVIDEIEMLAQFVPDEEEDDRQSVDCHYDDDLPTSVRAEVRRRRKPSLDKLIAKARAAGATSVLVEGVEMRFGEPAAGNGAATDLDRELAEFEARHET